MIQKIKLMILTYSTALLFTVTMLGSFIFIAPNVAAQPLFASSQSQACDGLTQLGGTGCGGGATSSITNLMKVTLELLSLIAGFIAVIMVIVSGIKFITANGDASAISSARQALLYAIAGIIVVAFAQILVHYVFNKTTGAK